jgi:hypothetical protein
MQCLKITLNRYFSIMWSLEAIRRFDSNMNVSDTDSEFHIDWYRYFKKNPSQERAPSIINYALTLLVVLLVSVDTPYASGDPLY